MAFKTLLASMLLVQSALGQCLGRAASPCGSAGYSLAGGYGAGLAGYGSGCGCGSSGVASTGGGLPVCSVSPIAPVGVSVISENAYEGQLCAGGNLPFLGSVAIDGSFPSGGAGAVSYGCGDGAIIIGNEAPIITGIDNPQTYSPSIGIIKGYAPGSGRGGIDERSIGRAAGYGRGGESYVCRCF